MHAVTSAHGARRYGRPAVVAIATLGVLATVSTANQASASVVASRPIATTVAAVEPEHTTTYLALYLDQARRAAMTPMARGQSTPVRTTTTARAATTSSARGLAVVAAAARQAGKPYVFGAAGPKAFDCSGFTLYVFRQFGVNLPHRAHLQRRAGFAVSRAQARPGDLIIFMRNGYGYHAAIYAGGNYMWDAPSRGGRVGKHKIWSSSIIFRRLV